MIARWHQCGTMTSQMLARASFSAVCLTVFPFELRPRTFTIGFYGKNSIISELISELMNLECSFPLKSVPPLCVTSSECQALFRVESLHLSILQVSSSKHNAKKITTRVRGPFHQSITVILTEEKREEKQFTKPTHVAVYLFRDLDRDRSRL